MNEIIKEILEELETEGDCAYVVGGYPRDLLLHKKSHDVDICTNASLEKLEKIFNIVPGFYGEIHFTKENLHFTITPLRREFEYKRNKLITFEFIKDIFIDLERRDFTINTFLLDKNGQFLDNFGAVNDLKDKVIKVVGNPEEKIKEDSLRILRAIRLATTLGFTLDWDLEMAIKKNKEKIENISLYHMKQEIDKILQSENFLVGLTLLKEMELFPFLGINYDKITYCEDLMGMWAQLEIKFSFPFTKKEKRNIVVWRKKLNIVYKDVIKEGDFS